MTYDYLDAIKADIRDWMNDNNDVVDYVGLTKSELYDKLNDDLWIADGVTGNGSGSYTFNCSEAKEYVQDDGDNYIRDMVKEGWLTSDKLVEYYLNEDYESIDVCIRCYLLGQAIDAVLNEDYPTIGWDDVVKGVEA